MTDFMRQSIIDLINEDARLKGIWMLIHKQDQGDPSHDVEHLLRVARWTNRILTNEVSDLSSERLVEATAAALLHDFINVPKNHPDRSAASALSADKAREIFEQAGFSSTQSAEMADAIRTHSFSRGEHPTSLLAQALQDADRLDALGAVGIFRCIAVSAQMGSKFSHPEDPFANHRSLDDRAFAVDHFFTKLFLLPDKMHMKTARCEAQKRVQFMRYFLSEFGTEVGVAAE
jgi:uncharacterized protein